MPRTSGLSGSPHTCLQRHADSKGTKSTFPANRSNRQSLASLHSRPEQHNALPNLSRYFGEDFDLKTKFQRDDPGAHVALPTQYSHSLWVLGGWMLAITDPL
ncbi:hypothetical protein SRHO_G00050160 [Serrasalmus rhombeus]